MFTFKIQWMHQLLVWLWLLNVVLVAQATDVQQVAEINPIGDGNVAHLTAFNNQLCFAAQDNATHGSELWCYAESSPPMMVADICPGALGSKPSDMVVFNDRLYFAATHPDYGRELWAYDGINAPYLVADINPSSSIYGAHGWVGSLHVFNNKLYFAATDATHLTELWVYDGINPPTLAQNLNPNGSSVPSELTAFNGRLYFTAFDTDSALLWEYDELNPAVVLPIQPTPSTPLGAYPQALQIYRDALYFSAEHALLGQQLWRYTGRNFPTPIGNVTAYNPTVAPYLEELTVFADKLYFTASYQESDADYRRLLGVYDAFGTPATVVANSPIAVSNLTVWQDKLYFSGYDYDTGFELWAYDGQNPPIQVEDINSGHYSASPRDLTVVNDQLYFSANISKNTAFTDYELFVLRPEVEPNCQIYGISEQNSNNSLLFTVINDYGHSPTANNAATLQDAYGEILTMVDEYYHVVTIGNLQVGVDIEDLDLHPNDVDLYASSGANSVAPGRLYSVNTSTGGLSLVGITGFAGINALSFNPADSGLWGWAQGQGLLKIDASTAQSNLYIPYTGTIAGLTWDNSGLMLYAAENAPLDGVAGQWVRLWRYNASTGEVSEACQANAFNVQIESLEALADGQLLFTYRGTHAIRNGIIRFTTPLQCEVFALPPIATPFNPVNSTVQGLAYSRDCTQ